MVPILSSHHFADCLNSDFAMAVPAGETIPLTLIEVREGINTPRQENFSLIFSGPLSPYYPQMIYRLEHEKLGTLDLFLVPIGPDGDRQKMQYEAVFNRLRERS
jgi:hypothetical protein